MQVSQSGRNNDFEEILVNELKELRSGEQNLRRLLPKLRTQPQLRDSFLLRLSDIRQRADRLNAVLDPVGALASSPFDSVPNVLPAA